MKTRYSIGEMSRLFDIPVTTLRHYDNKGIFKADYVDEESGYRYYSSEQFELLNNILNLRYSKISLEKIREYTQKGDLETLKGMFTEQQKELREKIEELKKAESGIERRLRYIEKVQGIERLNEVLVIKREERVIFPLRTSFESEEELELCVRELGRRSSFTSSLVLGSVGLIMDRNSMEYKGYAGVYLKGECFQEESSVEVQKAGEYLTVYFKGRREDSPNYYRMLKSYAEENNIETGEEYFETALVSEASSFGGRVYLRMIEVEKR